MLFLVERNFVLNGCTPSRFGQVYTVAQNKIVQDETLFR